MNKKAFASLIFILIGILVFTSYMPQVAHAEELFQEDESSEPDTQEQPPLFEEIPANIEEREFMNDEINWEMINDYNIAGVTLVPTNRALTYANWQDGCLASYYDGPSLKSFVYPIILPERSTILSVAATFKTDRAHSQNGYWIILWRTNGRKPGSTEKIFAQEVTLRNPGFKMTYWGFEHWTQPAQYAYWIEVYFPKGEAYSSICSVAIGYEMALP